ncbi:MAG TPA: TIR domain-containing protein [Anaerolineales bacterium]|nr:TIR domain-containing protein [Anaerolineales bacterium]
MAKVFISYSRKDIDFAKRLTGELQKSDLDFWIDWEGIPPTVDWWKEIEKGIEEANIFLFLISPDSASSKVCRQEIEVAVKNGKRIIPIVVREIDWDNTPQHLGHLNYIFFRVTDNFTGSVNKLLTAIQTDYEWAATHRRLQVKALDWERNNKENGYLLRGKDLQDAELDLASNTSKDPHPTDLQREFVFNSRKATDRQRRITTAISVIGVIALAGLAVFGFIQAGNATSQANVAKTAQANAEHAQSTAVANEQEAVLQKAQAEAESRRALSGQLALEAKSVLDQYPQRAQLLGLEALLVNVEAKEKTSPIAEEALRAANARVNGIGLPGFSKEVSFLEFSDNNQWLFAGSVYSGEYHAWILDQIHNPDYAPVEINLNADWDDTADFYFTDQKKWFVTTVKRRTWDTQISNYVYDSTEAFIYPLYLADPKVQPLHFENPILILNESLAFLDLQSDNTLLWIYDQGNLTEKTTFEIEGEFAAISLDKQTLVTKTLADNGINLIFWDISQAGRSQPERIFQTQFPTKNDDSLFFQITSHWLAAGESKQDTTSLSLYNIDNLENPPINIEIPASDNYYSVDIPSEDSWVKVSLSNDECICYELSSFLINLQDSTLTPVLATKNIEDLDNDYLLDDWYIYVLNDYGRENLTYYFVDLLGDDYDPDLFHTSIYTGWDQLDWNLINENNVTWLSYGEIDAINTNNLVSEGVLEIRPYSSFEPQQPEDENPFWDSVSRKGFEDAVVIDSTSPNDKWYAEGSYGGSLRLWSKDEETKYQLDSTGPYMMFGSDGKWLASGNKLWKLVDGFPSGQPIIFHEFPVYEAVFSPDANWLLYIADGRNLWLTDLNAFEKDQSSGRFKIEPPGLQPASFHFSPNNRWLQVNLWGDEGQALLDLANPQQLVWNNVPTSTEILRFTPDNKHILGFSTSLGDEMGGLPGPPRGTTIEIWKIPEQPTDNFIMVGSFESEKYSYLSMNGYWLIDEDHMLFDLRCVIQGDTCAPIDLDIHPDADVGFSPDSEFIYAKVNRDEGNETLYQIWDLENANGVDQTPPELSYEDVGSDNWGATHHWDIVQQTTGSIYLYGGGGGGGGGGPGSYKVDYGTEIIRPDSPSDTFHSVVLRGHEEFVSDRMISPSGKYALTISEDSIKLWDMDAVHEDPFTPPVNLPIETSEIDHYGFTMNEDWLVFIMEDGGSLEFHPMRLDILMAQACRSVGRNFIINEWQRYFLSADYEKTCEYLPEHPSVQLELGNAQ